MNAALDTRSYTTVLDGDFGVSFFAAWSWWFTTDNHAPVS